MSFTEQTLERDSSVSEAALDPFGRFLKLQEVMASIGVSQAMVYKLMHDEVMPFPKPVKVGRASLWIEREVIAWKARIVEASGLAS
ncbi:AlpA family transcriptional regulator [Parvularcula sp. IMCC14364]|uniref:helix-turn-helix transcriptional regulator n=1 Tax=Parvularcula sp. IMCC14364 TaxID=3067902 RepID=UPI0027412642|nr:AlpA family phage regulatory protein [Parvularcula sp. IMCC14364]